MKKQKNKTGGKNIDYIPPTISLPKYSSIMSYKYDVCNTIDKIGLHIMLSAGTLSIKAESTPLITFHKLDNLIKKILEDYRNFWEEYIK